MSEAHRPSTRSRNVDIDVARVLCVILVVVEHSSYAAITKFGLSEHYGVLDRAASPFRIPLLMFASGLFLDYSKKKTLPVYFKGKAATLLWPYLVFSALLGAVYSAFGDTFDRSLFHEFVDPRSPVWFLLYLFLYYAIARVTPARLYLIVSAIAIGSAAFLPLGSNIQRFAFLYGVFLFGGAVGLRPQLMGPRRGEVSSIWWITVRAAAFGAAVLAAFAAATGEIVRYNPAWAWAVFPALLFMPRFLGSIMSWRISAQVSAWSRYTIVALCTHILIVGFMARVCRVAGLDSSPAACYWLILAGTFLGTGGAVVLVRRIVPLGALFDARVFPDLLIGARGNFWKDGVRRL